MATGLGDVPSGDSPFPVDQEAEAHAPRSVRQTDSPFPEDEEAEAYGTRAQGAARQPLGEQAPASAPAPKDTAPVAVGGLEEFEVSDPAKTVSPRDIGLPLADAVLSSEEQEQLLAASSSVLETVGSLKGQIKALH